MIEHAGRPWLNYLLGLLCVGAIVAAILVVGPASGSQTTVTRTAKAAQGVVQSTVSGSGNLQPASQLNLGFKTSGTVTHIYVHQGQYVTQGTLLATLDPQSAEVTLEQAKAALQSAEANLAKEQETDGEGSVGSDSSSAANGTNAAAASVHHTSSASNTSNTEAQSTTEAPSTSTPGTTSMPGTASTPETKSTPETTRTTSSAPLHSKTESESTNSPMHSRESSSEATSKPTISTATREANLASARAAVRSDQLTVQSDEQAVQNTKLYAPEDGTIVSLSGQVGEVVSASGTTRASSASASNSSASNSGSGSSGAGASSALGRSASSSSSASSSNSSSSPFAVLSDLSSMQLVVALSESEIGNVKAGQIATVTVEALEGRKLAAHVKEVAILSTSSSGVVSYDVTFQLDQMESGLKPGMSATAEVVVKQAEGVNVPTSAISADSVTVLRDGKDISQRVVTGLAGNTSTIISSGLEAGETVVLPQASSTSSSATNLLSRLGSRLGGRGSLSGAGGLGGGGGGFVGGGGAAFFRGGG